MVVRHIGLVICLGMFSNFGFSGVSWCGAVAFVA